MGIRKIPFVNGEYYHVFNRGVDKRPVFITAEQQNFFFRRLIMLNTTDNRRHITNHRSRHKDQLILGEGDKLVNIVAYCLLPNHFHLLMQQQTDGGISQFMQRLGTSYTKFFNKQENRSGSLFQGKFKATHLNGELALPILSAYVNLNYMHHHIDPDTNLVKSSFMEYCREESESICEPLLIEKILDEVGGLMAYKKFAKQCSITFALNKNSELSEKDFEF